MDIIQFLREKSLLILPILVAVTFHEVAHGMVAYKLGDTTAKDAGRLTLNPIKHLDLFGSLVFIITGIIGWAKPVPVNPSKLKNPKKDMMWVSLAGPAANIVIAILMAVVLRLLLQPLSVQSFFDVRILFPILTMLKIGVIMNIGLAIFNAIPVPPLDGSKILMGLLPLKQAIAFSKLEPYGIFILLILIMTDIVDYTIAPVIHILVKVLLP
ncbi:MAG TPA: site-2 protease family protein [Thermodesulfovibrionia bacterium]|nr:site-2 protease family protein [Thermodesulfovibrionia bacterium]